MAKYRVVCGADEVAPGEGRRVVVEGREIALFNVDGTFHAVEDVCLHAGGPLHEGKLEGAVVECPWHQWRFDLATGVCALHRVTLERYDVRVRDGMVEIACGF